MPEIQAIYAPYITDNAISFELEVPTVEELWRRAEAILPVTPWLVAELDGRVAGYAYASPHRDRLAYQWTREVSVYVHPDYRKAGLATRLYSALFQIVRLQGFTNLLAGITQPNEPSVRFHEQMGFRLVGIYHQIGYKLGRYYDVGWWELPLCTREEPPRPYTPFAEIAHSDAVLAILQAETSGKL